MKVSPKKLSPGLMFTLSNGLAVSMLDEERQDGTREFQVYFTTASGAYFALDLGTRRRGIAFATKNQILALVEVLDGLRHAEARQAARTIVAFLEALVSE